MDTWEFCLSNPWKPELLTWTSISETEHRAWNSSGPTNFIQVNSFELRLAQNLFIIRIFLNSPVFFFLTDYLFYIFWRASKKKSFKLLISSLQFLLIILRRFSHDHIPPTRTNPPKKKRSSSSSPKAGKFLTLFSPFYLALFLPRRLLFAFSVAPQTFLQY